jgi:hypothetical protein
MLKENWWLANRNCKHCGKKYTPVQKTQKFCGAECRNAGYVYVGPRITNCLTCDEPFQKVNDNHKYCTPSCNPNTSFSTSRADLKLITIQPTVNENWQKKFYEKAKDLNNKKIKEEEQRKKKEYQDKIKVEEYQRKIPSSRIGDIEEIFVTYYFLQNRWEVFNNASAIGPADMVIWNKFSEEVYLIDVKSSEASASSLAVLQKAKKNNVKTGWFNRDKNKFIMYTNHDVKDLKWIEI